MVHNTGKDSISENKVFIFISTLHPQLIFLAFFFGKDSHSADGETHMLFVCCFFFAQYRWVGKKQLSTFQFHFEK